MSEGENSRYLLKPKLPERQSENRSLLGYPT